MEITSEEYDLLAKSKKSVKNYLDRFKSIFSFANVEATKDETLFITFTNLPEYWMILHVLDDNDFLVFWKEKFYRINNVDQINNILNWNYTIQYLKWVKDERIKNLTNSQARFAEIILKHNYLGDMETIFHSIRKHTRK